MIWLLQCIFVEATLDQHGFTSGGYEPVAKTLFGNCHVDGFFLEYDSERAGGFEPLRYIQNQKSCLRSCDF